jgi:transketolase
MVMNDSSHISSLKAKARELRATCIQLAHDGREGHLNGALSSVDLVAAIYSDFLRVSPDRTDDENRDRFIFSKGHACTSLYAVLADRGFIPASYLHRYAQDDTPLPSHPCTHALPVLECSSGSLGHGLGIAAGRGYGLRLKKSPARVVALLSDGECNEGSTWEAAMFAAANRIDNLLAVVDYNRIQSVGRTDDLNGFTCFADKFRAFGWAVRSIDGHDYEQILEALAAFPFETGKPSAIIATTTAGYGVSFMEDQVLWHYRVPSDEDLQKALSELGAVPLHILQPREATK